MSKQNISLALIILVLIIVGAFMMATNRENVSEMSQSVPSDYIGMTVVQANEKAERDGTIFRVVQEDGEPKPVTMDLREGRINAVVVAGVVTEYSVETAEVSVPEPDTQGIQIPSESVPPSPSSNHDAIIGMTVVEAELYAKTKNVNFRIGMIDGEGQAVTMDFQPGRITAEVEKGVVVRYSVEQE
ncbi:MAG: hypothetical protein V4668_04635 [Patescibacteria group bacterium]